MAKQFQASQAGQLKVYIQKGFEQAAHKAILAASIRVVGDIQARIIPAQTPPPVDRGLYRAVWRTRPTKRGADITNTSVQAPFIEYGVRAANVKPGRAMIDALTKWAQRKGLAPKKGRGATGVARGVAFAIATNMRKKGIFNRGAKGARGGLRILEQGLRGIESFFKKELKNAIKKGFR